MKTMKRFFSTVAVVAVLGIFMVSCGTIVQSGNNNVTVTQKVNVNTSDFYVEVDRIIPLGFPQKETLDGYFLSVKGDTLNCMLPYIGKANLSFADENAISIEADDYKISPKAYYNEKKKGYQVDFNFTNRYCAETFDVTVELYDSGYAYIRVSSAYRDMIQYHGMVTNRPTIKKIIKKK